MPVAHHSTQSSPNSQPLLWWSTPSNLIQSFDSFIFCLSFRLIYQLNDVEDGDDKFDWSQPLAVSRYPEFTFSKFDSNEFRPIFLNQVSIQKHYSNEKSK